MDDQTQASADRLRSAFEQGGRAVVTLRSLKSGEHLTVAFTAKKRNPEGGWISRASSAGRVGIAEADCVFIDDPSLPWHEGKVGSLDLATGEWRTAKGAGAFAADPARVWAAQHAFAFAFGTYDLEAKAEVFMSLQCSYCGKALTDPVSVERGVGPDCWGKHTGSKAVPHAHALEVVA